MAWTSHKLIEYFFSLHFPEERPPFLRRSTPLDAFQRLIGLLENSTSGVRRFLKVLGGANLASIRRTVETKTRCIPAGFMR